jgi:hypothetical protein
MMQCSGVQCSGVRVMQTQMSLDRWNLRGALQSVTGSVCTCILNLIKTFEHAIK